ncbi:hypothetical protein C9374_008493 [Naegleria lovaniensis]|uniref:Pecanex C-terminal domain-containing protein n=1 Tax=Naegleria lovaniensis TaxID=51637 RepID=A0AA88GKB4_NAELO|nr:uncharacterized protein C9374_008493 [Naegleria lovaniensis]KAG2378350.1 hypothetical protein C9374_008493 [Naegleria lovaniensis]
MGLVQAVLFFFVKQFTYSLTGGLYYEHAAYLFINVIHILFYTFFILFPLFFILVFGFGNIFAEIIYSCCILLFFGVIKIFNVYFHEYFDSHSKQEKITAKTTTTAPTTSTVNNIHSNDNNNNPTTTDPPRNDDHLNNHANTITIEEVEEKPISYENKNSTTNGPTTTAIASSSEEQQQQQPQTEDIQNISISIVDSQENNTLSSSNNNSTTREQQQQNSSSPQVVVGIVPQLDGPSDDHEDESSSSKSSSSSSGTNIPVHVHHTTTTTTTRAAHETTVSGETETLPTNNGSSNSHSQQDQEPSSSSGHEANASPKIPEMRTFVFEFVDEFGDIQSYEMSVTLEEYERLMREKKKNSRATSPTSTPVANTAENGEGASRTSITPPQHLSRIPAATASSSQQKDTSSDYKISIFGKSYHVFFDRRTLEYLFDRDHNPRVEVLAVPLIAFGVAWMGLRLTALLDRNWASIVFMILAIAQSHFSLIKSPKPEANSPFHFSRGSNYTRSFYVLFFGTIALICHAISRVSDPFVVIYGLNINFGLIFLSVKDIATFIIMCFPIIFLFGVLPQPMSFIFVFCEQIHMHMFGGSGSISLYGLLFQLFSSLVTVGILIGVGYTSALNLTWTSDYYSAFYSGVLVSGCYILSRMPSNHRFYTSIFEDVFALYWDNYIPSKIRKQQKTKDEIRERKNKELELNISNVNPILRIVKDLAIAVVLFIVAFVPQLWDAFQRGNPYLLYVLTALNVFIGILCYYIYPHLSKHHPFTIFRYPLLSKNQPSVKFLGKQKWIWYELVFYILQWTEHVFYVVIILSSISSTVFHLQTKCHAGVALTIASICAVKLMRCTFSDPTRLTSALFFSVIISHVDAFNISEGLLVDFFVFTYIMPKMAEIGRKLQFICIYSTPLSWSSGLYIIMQPLGIPFSQFFFVQLIYSVISNAPMYPLIGGALWFLGYSRAAKFFEKDYRTSRKDVTNQTLGQTLEGGGLDQHTVDNLNSIFYEHLVNALRERFPEIIRKGQVGPIQQGDIFIFINDNLTAIVHIIEVGNGVFSFQIRGLEFKGTICQEEEQRNLLSRINRDEEAMFDAWCEDGCSPYAPKLELLSIKDIITLRWHSWEVVQTGIKLKTYNMLENKVDNLMSSNDERKAVVTLYVRSVLYYVIQSDQLDRWIQADHSFCPHIDKIGNQKKMDFDPLFTSKFDIDFDASGMGGVSYTKFIEKHHDFMNYFIEDRKKSRNGLNYNEEQVERIRKLCFLASLTARRALASHDGTTSAHSLRTFIQKVHTLFVGDYRITSTNDEWVFNDISILDHCIKPAICMALRLYQARFAAEEVDAPEVFCNLIKDDYKDLVIAHEGDPKWRESIMADQSELFSLRKKVLDKGAIDYFILMLEMREIEFSIVKLNKEGVRGLWASQQHELVYLGVEQPERASIQNMSHTLRNICNSSMDIPIGYPVMVSSVTTAYW